MTRQPMTLTQPMKTKRLSEYRQSELLHQAKRLGLGEYEVKATFFTTPLLRMYGVTGIRPFGLYRVRVRLTENNLLVLDLPAKAKVENSNLKVES